MNLYRVTFFKEYTAEDRVLRVSVVADSFTSALRLALPEDQTQFKSFQIEREDLVVVQR